MLFNRWQGGGGNALIRGLSPAAWFRLGQGITITGAGVSQWDDQSGNARHLKQATDTRRPALQADGSILFDGVDNCIKTDAFTLNQPTTVYFLGKQVTWTFQDTLVDGNAGNDLRITQGAVGGTTPKISIYAGTELGNITTLAVDTYGVIAAVFNGASSSIQHSLNAATTGAAGAANAGAITLGAFGDLSSGFSNIQVKELIVFAAAHTAAQRQSVIYYLAGVGGITV
jgi:hypothetical protein